MLVVLKSNRKKERGMSVISICIYIYITNEIELAPSTLAHPTFFFLTIKKGILMELGFISDENSWAAKLGF